MKTDWLVRDYSMPIEKRSIQKRRVQQSIQRLLVCIAFIAKRNVVFDVIVWLGSRNSCYSVKPNRIEYKMHKRNLKGRKMEMRRDNVIY